LDWFPPAESYFKRILIQRLIFELVKNHDNEGFSHDNVDDHHHSEYNDNKIGHLVNGEASTSHAGRGIEMAPSFDTSSMVLKDHFEPEATPGTSLRHCQSFDKRSSNHCFNGSIFKMEVRTMFFLLYHIETFFNFPFSCGSSFILASSRCYMGLTLLLCPSIHSLLC